MNPTPKIKSTCWKKYLWIVNWAFFKFNSFFRSFFFIRAKSTFNAVFAVRFDTSRHQVHCKLLLFLFACCTHLHNTHLPGLLKKAHFALNVSVRSLDRHTIVNSVVQSPKCFASRTIQAFDMYQSTIRPTTEK